MANQQQGKFGKDGGGCGGDVREDKCKIVGGLIKVRDSCDHLASISMDLDHIPHPVTPCNLCHRPQANWLCLCCKIVLCSSMNQHMLQHHLQTNHSMALGYDDLLVWCYSCNAYLNVQVILQLQPLYEMAYRLKCGETLPCQTIKYPDVEEVILSKVGSRNPVLSKLEHQPDNHTKEEITYTTVSGLVKVRNFCIHLIWMSSDLIDIPHPDTPCQRCNHPQENWLCLSCKIVLCGRFINQHMLQHYQQTNHCLVLGYGDLSVWCYPCGAYLHAQVIPQLQHVYETAHKLKFGKTPSSLTVESPFMEDHQADGFECKEGNQKEGKKRRRRKRKTKNSVQEESTIKASESPMEKRSIEGILDLMSSSDTSDGNEDSLKVLEKDMSAATIPEDNLLQSGLNQPSEAPPSDLGLIKQKVENKQCLCGQEPLIKTPSSVKNKNKLSYTFKENKCDFSEQCFYNEAREVDVGNKVLQDQVMNSANVAELKAEVQSLSAQIKMIESNFGLMKMMALMNVFYGFMLILVVIVLLLKH